MVGLELSRRLAAAGHELSAAYLDHPLQEFAPLKLDILNERSVQAAFDTIRPDWVIHCAAMTNVDECERHPAQAMEINANASGRLARAAAAHGARFAYISTSFVFGNHPAGLRLDETAVADPINEYGKSKLEGERQTAAASAEHLILRIDQPYGWTPAWQKTNMVKRTLEQFAAGRPFSVFNDWYNQPTFLSNFAQVCQALIETDSRGIFHCAGADHLSRYEWALRIGKIFGLDTGLVSQNTSASMNFPARRPNVALDCRAAEKRTGMRMAGVDEGLKQMKKERRAD